MEERRGDRCEEERVERRQVGGGGEKSRHLSYHHSQKNKRHTRRVSVSVCQQHSHKP
jgi:hypothetical protein